MALFSNHVDTNISPTKLVLFYLKKSTTVYTISSNWWHDLKENPIFSTRTVFLQTPEAQYYGMHANGGLLNRNGIKAMFNITREGAVVTVDTSIELVTIKQAESENDRLVMREFYEQAENRVQEQNDQFTTCKIGLKNQLSHTALKLLSRLIITGKTCMPYTTFLREIAH